VTSHQRHSQPTFKTQTPIVTALYCEACSNLAFNRMVTFLMVIGLMILATCYGQPLLAQTEVAQPLTNQTDRDAIKREILLLGDPDPTVRKNAKAAIESFGNTAISELRRAAKFETTNDYETQIMAAKILATIENAIALKEADKFVTGEKELAGWPAFKELTGDTPEIRLLFQDIYLQNRNELLRATSPPASGTDQKYNVSYTQLKQLIESSDLVQVCFGMFLLARKQNEQETVEANAGIQSVRIGPSLEQMKFLFSTLAQRNSPLAQLDVQDRGPAMLVRAIIESAPQAPQLLANKISLIKQIKSKEISPLVLKFATPENPTAIRAQVIEHAFEIADQDTIEKLNVYLNDTTEVGKYLVLPPGEAPIDQQPKRLISQVQIRDLVLLGNLRLNKRAITEFGFSADAIDTTNKFNVKQAGFVDNQTREKAFERFRNTTDNNQ